VQAVVLARGFSLGGEKFAESILIRKDVPLSFAGAFLPATNQDDGAGWWPAPCVFSGSVTRWRGPLPAQEEEERARAGRCGRKLGIVARG
jgi:hypothetical protein